MGKLAKDGFLRLKKLINIIYEYGEKENKTPEEAERYFIDISSAIIDNFGLRHPSSFIETIEK